MNDRERYLFYSKLASLLDAGVGLDSALGILAKHAYSEEQRTMLEEMERRVVEGFQLSEVMDISDEDFTELERKIVSSGEAQNTLPETLDHIASTIEVKYRWSLDRRGDLIYGILLIIFGLAIFTLVQASIVPLYYDYINMIKEMSEDWGQSLPSFTLFYIPITNFFYYNCWLLIGILIFIGALIYIGRKKLYASLSRIPFLGRYYVLIDSVYFSKSMALGLSSGLPLSECVHLAKSSVRNSYFEKKLNQAKAEVIEGKKLWVQLKKIKTFPKPLLNIIDQGEYQGNLEAAFTEATKVGERLLELRTTIHFNTLALIITSLILFFTVWAIISVYLPLYSIAGW